MTILAIILVACSAVMHASWNLICKSKKPSAAFFLVSTAASIIAMMPLTIYFSDAIWQIPKTVWLLLVITAGVQALYYVCLGNAYRLSEISIAYPLARALPVLFVPAVTIFLSLGKPLNSAVLSGMLLVTLGCVILPIRSLKTLTLKDYINKGSIFVLGAALMTTAYTVIDSEALKLFRSASMASYIQTAIIYVALENIGIEIILLPYVFSHKKEREILADMAKNEMLRYPMSSGVICTASYTLILIAMMLAANVSYIAAFRQMGIPLGAILGIILFKEKFHWPKLAGIICITIGLLIVGICK